ncbi:ABC transporter ATP-binding protein [Desulfolithobacter sp.]
MQDDIPQQKESAPESTETTTGEALGLILPIFHRYRRRLLLGFMALLGVDFLQLLIPRLLGFGVDRLAAGTATGQTLLQTGGLILLAGLGVAGLRFVWRYQIIGFSRRLERALRDRIFKHVLGLDRYFFERSSTGEIMAHATNDTAAVQMACGMGLVAAIDALVMAVAVIAFMLHINIFLTLIALLPMPFLVLLTRILATRMHRRFNRVQHHFSLLTEFARSTLVSIRFIKVYTLEGLQIRHFDRFGRDLVRENLKVATIQGLLFPAATLVGNLGMLLVLYFGGRLVILSVISLGEFVAFTSYLFMLVWPMMAVGWVTNIMQRGMTSLRRVSTLLCARPILTDPPRTDERPVRDPVFTLRRLNFSCPATGQRILREIELEIGPGLIGITGRSGSGKSSLCRLLARMYPVADGTLFFDHRDVNTLTLDLVRSHIAWVEQEPVLFGDTIYENILLGRPGASRREVEEAARRACIHDEILDLPKGYQTLVGERGVNLSGGQRQRLALARALLSNRPVLIIDDGLSAIDVDTEEKILSWLLHPRAARTVVVVSHRIKLLRSMDRIVILDQGRVIHQGSHRELLERSRLYRIMHEKQHRSRELGR